MEVLINGEPVTVEDRSSLAAALAAVGYRPGKAAVAVNEAFVPRAQHPDVLLAPGDRIDIIARIEGG